MLFVLIVHVDYEMVVSMRSGDLFDQGMESEIRLWFIVSRVSALAFSFRISLMNNSGSISGSWDDPGPTSSGSLQRL